MRAVDVEVGNKFERLTVLSTEFRRTKSGAAYFLCRCDCGTEKEFLFRGFFMAKSCGCLQKEKARTGKLTHGQSRTPLYRVWQGMKDRCYNPRRKEYPNYGGRGITVCDEWLKDPQAFITWAKDTGWERGLDIDRIDNDGPYSPENCRFVTRADNLYNRRTTRTITAFGETKTLKEWTNDPRCSVTQAILQTRCERGWDPEDAITLPRHTKARTT